MARREIGIDCWFACIEPPRGIGRVTIEFLENLSKAKTNEKFILFVPKINDFIKKLISDPKFEVIVTSKNYFIHEQIMIPLIGFNRDIKILHSLANTTPLFMLHNCARFVNIHDLIFLEDNLLFQVKHMKLGSLYRRFNISFIKKIKNLKVFTHSEYVKSKIEETGISEDIHVIYHGFELEKYTHFENSMSRKGNYILALGALDQRKNTLKTIQAFIATKLYQHGIMLRVVGLQSIEKFCKINHLEINELDKFGIKLNEWVSDEELSSLYHGCLAFVYVSLSEGFGLPIVEAELHGAKVLTSNTTSCAEVGSPYVLRVDPEDKDKICETLLSLLNNGKLSSPPERKWAEKYSWNKIIYEYINHYGA